MNNQIPQQRTGYFGVAQNMVERGVRSGQNMMVQLQTMIQEDQKRFNEINKRTSQFKTQLQNSSSLGEYLKFSRDVLKNLRGVYLPEISPYYTIPPGYLGSYLMGIPIRSIDSALEIFGSKHPNGCVPVVLLPKKNTLRFFCSIPKGVSAILVSWGKISRVVKEGFCFLGVGESIKWVVTNLNLTYDYPVKDVPTIDNVMIKIDTLVVFNIDDPIKFVTKLGPYKLNDFLSSFIEESIRSLARTVTYTEAYDLRGKDLSSMIRSLDEKLDPFGIKITDITITNVVLPPLLAALEESKTKFIAKSRVLKRKQQHDKKKINYQNLEVITQKIRGHERLETSLNGQRARSLIQKEIAEITQITKKRMSEINSEKQFQINSLKHQSELEKEILIGKKYQLLKKLRSEGKKESSIKIAQSKCFVNLNNSESTLKCAPNKVKSILSIANEEGNAYINLKEKRKLEIKKLKYQIIENLSQNDNCFISGPSDYSSWSQIASINKKNQKIATKMIKMAGPGV